MLQGSQKLSWRSYFNIFVCLFVDNDDHVENYYSQNYSGIISHCQFEKYIPKPQPSSHITTLFTLLVLLQWNKQQILMISTLKKGKFDKP